MNTPKANGVMTMITESNLQRKNSTRDRNWTRSIDTAARRCVPLAKKNVLIHAGILVVSRSVMQGVGACRDEPLLHAVPWVDDIFAVAGRRRWNPVSVPSGGMVVVVVVRLVMVMVTVVVVVIGRWLRGGVEAGHGEQHLPRNGDDRACPPGQQASAAEAAAAPVERDGKHGEPQEEGGGGDGGARRSSHCHRAAGCWRASELMDMGPRAGPIELL